MRAPDWQSASDSNSCFLLEELERLSVNAIPSYDCYMTRSLIVVTHY